MSFPVWGTTARLLVTDARRIDLARRALDLEITAMGAACDRFRPESELSRVNAAEGRAMRVSALFAETLRRTLEVARATGGLVDPFVLTTTSLLRTRIGLRWWRGLHWAAYACWGTALIHALGTGTDTRTSAFLILAGVCAAVTLAVVAWRLASASPRHHGARLAVGLAILLVAAGIAAWTVRGPLEPGWARRSGTPASLLPKSAKAGE